MTYTKNPIMEYLQVDEENIIIYNTETRDTHYIGGSGKEILDLIGDGIELTALLNQLCKLYDESESEIDLQARAFLDELTEKGVLVLQ